MTREGNDLSTNPVRSRAKAEAPAPEEPGTLNLKSLKEKKIAELAALAKDMNIEGAAAMRKQELIFSILQAQTEQNGFICGEGVLEILPDGFGFLRAPDSTTSPVPTISTSRRARSAASTCAPATWSPDRSAPPRKASATSRCSRSRPSTSRSRRRRARRSSSTT